MRDAGKDSEEDTADVVSALKEPPSGEAATKHVATPLIGLLCRGEGERGGGCTEGTQDKEDPTVGVGGRVISPRK